MSRYFHYFPKVEHDLKNNTNSVLLTNILKRFKFNSDVFSSGDVWYTYDLYEEDRPDIIAGKYYGDPKLAWVVLLFNKILDPLFEWPMNTVSFENYIIGKYGSRSSAQGTIHEYRWILQEEQMTYDGRKIPKEYVVVDEVSANQLDEIHKEIITKWDWEKELNESRRTIKILDKRYIRQLINEVKDILK